MSYALPNQFNAPIPSAPHPFLVSEKLYITRVPVEIKKMSLTDTLKFGAGAKLTELFSFTLLPGQDPSKVSIEDLPWSGIVYFDRLIDAEMILATFPSSRKARETGIQMSPYPGAAPMPPLAGIGRARHIVPMAHGTMARPSARDLFWLLRPWGSVKSISVGTMSGWVARVEFWHECEAVRFEDALTMANGRLGPHVVSVYLEGSAQYTIGIRTSPPAMPMVVMPLPPLPPMPCFTSPPPPPMPYGMPYPITYSTGLGPRAISMEVNSMNRIQHVGPMRATSLPHAPRPRAPSIWKEMMGESGPLGVVNERGIRVPHKEGQCVRVVEGGPSGPNLIDYCNLRVKHLPAVLDEDDFKSLWTPLEGFKNSVVCRDDRDGRCKGYGFANFFTPELAAIALKAMNGKQCGTRKMSISYHQPTRLKPEKPLPGFGSAG